MTNKKNIVTGERKRPLLCFRNIYIILPVAAILIAATTGLSFADDFTSLNRGEYNRQIDNPGIKDGMLPGFRKGGSSSKIQPRVGVLPGYIMPLGNLSGPVKPAVGGSLFADVVIPISELTREKMQLRAGMQGGYQKHTVETEKQKGDLTLVPVLAYLEFSYKSTIGLIPFFSLKAGMSITNLSTEYTDGTPINESSTDVSFAAGAGVRYSIPGLSGLELILGVDYLMIFESVNGQFAPMTFGVAYTFR